jgi:hypothetical protein
VGSKVDFKNRIIIIIIGYRYHHARHPSSQSLIYVHRRHHKNSFPFKRLGWCIGLFLRNVVVCFYFFLMKSIAIDQTLLREISSGQEGMNQHFHCLHTGEEEVMDSSRWVLCRWKSCRTIAQIVPQPQISGKVVWSTFSLQLPMLHPDVISTVLLAAISTNKWRSEERHNRILQLGETTQNLPGLLFLCNLILLQLILSNNECKKTWLENAKAYAVLLYEQLFGTSTLECASHVIVDFATNLGSTRIGE